MSGVGPAAQVAAYQAAGVGVRRLATAFELTSTQITALVLGIRLHEARRLDPDLQLVCDQVVCMIVGCDRPLTRWQLCARHLTRLYSGAPLAGPRPRSTPTRMGACVSCGATWCELTRARHRTCGAAACRTAQPSQLRNVDRDQAILERVLAGEQYRHIAADYSLSKERINQIANRAGHFRYQPRSEKQKATRARSIARAADSERRSLG